MKPKKLVKQLLSILGINLCGTCARQTKILNEAQKDFPDVIFLSYEQTKHKDIAKLLNVDYWATIIVYKNSKRGCKRNRSHK